MLKIRPKSIFVISDEIGSPHLGGGRGAQLLASHFRGRLREMGYDITQHQIPPYSGKTESELLKQVFSELTPHLKTPGCIFCFTSTHAIVPALVAAVKCAAGNQAVGLIWIDAHPDVHTPTTSKTGQMHGMSLGLILGRLDPGNQRWETLRSALGGLSPSPVCRAVALGVRDAEEGENVALKDLQVPIVTVKTIRSNPLGAAAEALAYLDGCQRLVVSFDMDFVDATLLPGSASPAWFGPTLVETGELLRALFADSRIGLVEVTEYNPFFDCNTYGLQHVASLLAFACCHINDGHYHAV
jgi:arginase